MVAVLDNGKAAAEDCGEYVEAMMGEVAVAAVDVADNNSIITTMTPMTTTMMAAMTTTVATTRQQQQQVRHWKGWHNVDAEGKGGKKF
jgi:hypothetical protein